MVRLDGHADATGTAEGNRLLSPRRAEAVRDHLVSPRLKPGLLVVQGHGATDLHNARDPGAAENRRVEIRCDLDR